MGKARNNYSPAQNRCGIAPACPNWRPPSPAISLPSPPGNIPKLVIFIFLRGVPEWYRPERFPCSAAECALYIGLPLLEVQAAPGTAIVGHFLHLQSGKAVRECPRNSRPRQQSRQAHSHSVPTSAIPEAGASATGCNVASTAATIARLERLLEDSGFGWEKTRQARSC